MLKSPEKCTLKELKAYASEYQRRLGLGRANRPKVLRPCHKCGVMLGARELREHKCKVIGFGGRPIGRR